MQFEAVDLSTHGPRQRLEAKFRLRIRRLIVDASESKVSATTLAQITTKVACTEATPLDALASLASTAAVRRTGRATLPISLNRCLCVPIITVKVKVEPGVPDGEIWMTSRTLSQLVGTQHLTCKEARCRPMTVVEVSRLWEQDRA
jgi:hypothetical protein